MSETLYYLSSCSLFSETAAANPMKPYSKEDAAEIIAHEGGTAYVLATDYERELAAKTAEVERLRAKVFEVLSWHRNEYNHLTIDMLNTALSGALRGTK